MYKKVLDYILVLIVILSMNFFLPRLLPGDPLTTIYGDSLLDLNPLLKERIISTYGLDLPLVKQFLLYLKGLARGDLGYSMYFQQPVVEVIAGGLTWTLLLSGTALVISTVAGTLLGIESARRRGSLGDGFLLLLVMFFNAMPVFFIGLLLVLLAGVKLSLLPISGSSSHHLQLTGVSMWLDIMKHLALPALTLALTLVPRNYLLMRNSMVTVLGKPYVMTAEGKGLSVRAVAYRHAARNALLPVVIRLGMTFGLMITSCILVEKVFAYPGLGHLFTLALYKHDYPLVQGILLVLTIMVLAGNLVADIVAIKLDPRVKDHAY